MLPTSPEFFCFFLIVFFAYWLLLRLPRAATILVCAANLFFCWKWGWIYLILVPGASVCDFFIGRALPATPANRRRALLFASVALNIGLIVICRYIPFLTGSASGWVLPLSLSFYAFQALTYTIDIFRGQAQPAPDYLTYFASVSFSPSLLAGPISRVAALLPQWTRSAPLSAEEGGRALFLIGLGLSKKFLIADYLAQNLINRVFDLPALYSGGDVLVAVYGYAFQLYYDFSGYSDIAIGAALLLGIQLPINFNSPYRARDIADFWRRWHISLSNWLRDYLFFSLPGKRSKWRPYLNLIFTMAIGGLWHGANWTFLVWGLLHGFGLAFFRGWQSWRGKRKGPAPAWRIALNVLLTFHFVLFSWIFFRAPNLTTAGTILKQIGTFPYAFDNTSAPFLFVLSIALVAHFFPRSWLDISLRGFSRAPALVQAAALVLLVAAIAYVGSTGAAPFIYTKF